MTDAGPTYTVKEMLAVMAKQADDRHVEIQRTLLRLEQRVDTLVRERIEPLERDVARRVGANDARRAIWVVGTGLFGMICALPSLLVLLQR